MKRVLQWILCIFVALTVGGYVLGEWTSFDVDIFLTIAVLLLVAVFVVYYSKYGGTRCPNCNFRINSKHTRYKDCNGRIPCPRCGEIIDVNN